MNLCEKGRDGLTDWYIPPECYVYVRCRESERHWLAYYSSRWPRTKEDDYRQGSCLQAVDYWQGKIDRLVKEATLSRVQKEVP